MIDGNIIDFLFVKSLLSSLSIIKIVGHYIGIHLDNRIVSAVKRQIPFLVGGTITGIVMTHFLGFPITFVVNSAIWYVISQIWYKVVWRKKGVEDQKLLLKYLLTKIRPQKYSRYSHNLE